MKLNRILGITPSKEYESIATGFHKLDLITGGLRIGQLCTIAARLGMGKTQFAVSLMRNIGVVQKVPTAYLSLELDELEIARRLKASITGSWYAIPYKETKSFKETPQLMDFIQEMEKQGFPLKRVQNAEQEAMQMMKEAPVWIEHDSGVGMNEIVSRMERLHQENHVRLVIIDSMQWIKFADMQIEQSQASQTLMKLCQAAERLKMAVILTSGLSRPYEFRSGALRPELRDLRNRNQIETFSSMVMLIYRPDYYKLESFEDGSISENMADIMVVKNSFGHTGNVRMHSYNCAGFGEISYEDDTDCIDHKRANCQGLRETSYEDDNVTIFFPTSHKDNCDVFPY